MFFSKYLEVGEKWVFGIDLGASKFQHAIVYLDNLYYIDADVPHLYLKDFNVYVGENSDYKLNPKCAGGPFLGADDEASKLGGKWKHFKEVWCNLKGQYMHIVADINTYTVWMSIGSLAIIGSDYDRPTPIPTSVDIFASESMTIEIAAVESLHTIGNVLDIKL